MKTEGYKHSVSAVFSLGIHGILAYFLMISLPLETRQDLNSIEIVLEKPRELPAKKVAILQKEKKQKIVKPKETNVIAPQATPTLNPRIASHYVSQSVAESEQKSLPQPQIKLAHKSLPPYPWICRKRHQEGIVLLKVQTNAKGGVENISLHQSSGHSRLDEVALAAVKSWTFVESHSEKILSIVFRLKA